MRPALRNPLRGLYLVTPDAPADPAELAARVTAALRGGARLVQYRDKSDDTARRQRAASTLLGVCRAHSTPLLINDDVDLALRVGASGVHLGRDDMPPADARRRLGRGSIIGVSCYGEYARAEQAVAAGADYVAFGSFHDSPTKPNAPRATPDLLRRARRELRVPTVAIGGISPENGAALVAAGASMLAVISAVFDADDVGAAARAFAPCFHRAEESSP